MATAIRAFVALFAVGVPCAAFGQSDTEPPVLTDFDFTPTSVDVTGGPANVSCTMTITDSPAGVLTAGCKFRSPSRNYAESCQTYSLSSGDIYNGTWVCSITIPQFAEPGSWYVEYVHVKDTVDNPRTYYTPELQQLGFPTDLDVASEQDTEPPVLTDFDFTPKSVDVTGGPANVSCTMTITDSPAGVLTAGCKFRSPSRNYAESCQTYSLSSGDIYNGTWVCSATIPQYSEEGTWTVEDVHVKDTVDNPRTYYTPELQQLGFPTDLDVASEQDTEPPVLTDFDFTPKSVDVTGGPANVSCTMTITDSPAGVLTAGCKFRSPSRNYAESCQTYSLSSGDIYNGTWVCSVTIPQYSEEGTWTVEDVHVKDTVDNPRTCETNELEASGLPTELAVGFANGEAVAVVSTPRSGVIVRGNSVTVRARLTRGNPDGISPVFGVRFESRSLPLGTLSTIPARNPNHPNPDTAYPYFIHWDVSGVAEGDYELRAVAHDLAGTPDPAPETITITIDHGGPADVDENENAGGLQESRTAVDDAIESEAGSGDHTEASTATEFIVPAGALAYATDTTVMTHLDPATEIPLLEQPEQDLGSYVDAVLESGQTVFEGGATSDLDISYSDRDQDGVVDGTNVREDEIELRYYDDVSGTYLRASGWIVMTEHNMLHADITTTGRYALAGPLQPRILFEVGKQSLTWDLVAEATAYNVYRGLLGDLVDTDQDGLPDDGYGDCMNHLDPDTTDGVFVDDEAPASSRAGFFYVVSYVGPADESTLGNTSQGLKRGVIANCP